MKERNSPQDDQRAVLSETELTRRLALLSTLLNNLPGMVFRCLYDRDLTFEYASAGSSKILGYEPDKIVNGYAFRQLVHKEDQANNKKIIAGLAPVNDSYTMTYRMRAAWGEYRWIHEQGKAIFSATGKLVAIEGLLTDITDQKLKEIKLREENVRLRSSIRERYRLGELIGKSAAMQKVYQHIMKAAETDAIVSITGESGTGKELVARAIHDLSERRNKPFVAVNCGAITESLMESEFFGHLRGSFSGAYGDRDGFLKAAEGGTLFLDEIGEMPLQLQIKLLRALDGKGFTPVGSTKSCTSNFRLISATNRDLVRMVREGTMREDFYYRINTVPILVPPLRSRKEDLPLLIDHFISQSDDGEKTVELPANVYITLGEHHWPGNVRELQNVLRRYLTLHEISFNPSFAPEVFSARQTNPQPVSEAVALQVNVPISSTLAATEKELLLAKLNECRWHIGKTAAALGISRRTLQRRLNRYNLH